MPTADGHFRPLQGYMMLNIVKYWR